jgi:hypothetical protein
MNIESQVTSFELSKRLKELNIEQNSLFCWLDGINREEYRIFPNEPCFPALDWQKGKHKTHNDGYSAFNVAELLALIPRSIILPTTAPYNSFRFHMEKGTWWKTHPVGIFYDYYIINYLCDTWNPESGWPPINLLVHNISDENPANALALMLIYLYENGLINND